MKYKTFRALMVGGAGVLGVGAIVALTSGDDHPSDSSRETSTRPQAVVAASASPDVPSSPSSPSSPASTDTRGQPLRAFDRSLLELAGVPNAKGKDLLSGTAVKANLYQDEGYDLPNRAKVDLDRDDKWDEKWTFEAGFVKRQVAPADDEVYTLEYQRVGDRWMTAAEAAMPTASTPTPVPDSAVAGTAEAGADTVVQWHQDLLVLARKPLAGGKGKDVLGGGKAKVNLYQDDGQPLPNRAKVDLDRDEKWDEKWDFEGPAEDRKVKRHVAPADDEQYSHEYRLVGGRWKMK